MANNNALAQSVQIKQRISTQEEIDGVSKNIEAKVEELKKKT